MLLRGLLFAAAIASVMCLVVSCARERPAEPKDTSATESLAGTWLLTSRLTDEGEKPAENRLVKLALDKNGTFRFLFQGDKTQPWIAPGEGAFSYTPPTLTFYWDNGSRVSFLVVEKSDERMRLHRGFNLVPMRGADPDEVYMKTPATDGTS